MKVIIVGGRLQGVEAAYLARKAGWEVMVIDKDPAVPASGLSDVFIQKDAGDSGCMNTLLKDAELVIPAVENEKLLAGLDKWCSETGIPFAFDIDAYAVSSSKLKSDRLFAQIGVPAPVPWPGCGFPVVAKPSEESGSEGVRIFQNRRQLEGYFSQGIPSGGWVLQEYVEGASFSLEIVGVPGNYTPLQVTDLEMDAGYDCKRVVAPTLLSGEQTVQFEKISLEIAEAVQLRGLMDVEVILHDGQLKVLEIDARLPSQTPTAVYKSSGLNMLQVLTEYFLDNKKFCRGPGGGFSKEPLGVLYEHIKVSPGVMEVCGEHIMADAGPLRLCTDFYGADEAITNYEPGRSDWVATLIITGADRQDAWERRNHVIRNLQAHFKIEVYNDPS